jgi:hypothetical protein
VAKHYNDSLDPEQQVDVEESIAAFLFDEVRLHHWAGFAEEDAAEASRVILRLVLGEFRPDLFVEEMSDE